MRGRIDHLLELARLAGKVLLSYSVAAWLLYLLLGILLPRLLASGSLLTLFGALVLALPAPLLLSRGSRTRRPDRLRGAWESMDRSDPARLEEFHELLQQQTGLSRDMREDWEARLLEAWQGVHLPLDASTARGLCDLLSVRVRLVREDLGLLLRLRPELVPPMDLLRLWNRAEGDGLDPDRAALAEICRAAGEGTPPRGLRRVKGLLFRLVRENLPAGRDLLESSLRVGRLRLRDLPPDLRPLFAHLPSEAGRTGPTPLGGIPFLRYLSLESWSRRLQSGMWWKLAVLLGVAAGAVLVSRLAEQKPAPMQAPPATSYDYAPPANVESGFTLQILASRDSAQTVAYVQRLHGDGRYAYALAPRSNSTYYRVRLGWFQDRAAADSVAGLLRQRGVIDEWYVANFDREERLFESLIAAPDSAESSPGTED